VRFSLQDVKKSIQRRDGELFVSLHFLRPGELQEEIARLIAYHEELLGQPQRNFSLDDARSYIGDYRLAHCLIATLSHWYSWQQREWAAVLQTLTGSPDLADITSSVQLRLALYNYVNQLHRGFLGAQERARALQAFATNYQLAVADLEYLLALDSEEEALLSRTTPQAPDVQDVATLYNQWVFEAALFNASGVSFVIDCQAFSKKAGQAAAGAVGMGVGAVIKRLSYLARKLGVYYDLTYDAALPGEQTALELPAATAPLLTLTLYGPQEVTGVPQHYGLRLARLCRLLLGYGIAHAERGQARNKGRTLLTAAIVEAEAKVHFLQRAYTFAMDSHVLKFIESPHEEAAQHDLTAASHTAATLFDSSIEQSFSEAFQSLAGGWGMDGWELEREPEPLLLPQSIFIPDFALSRANRRIYVEILGFWTPAYRERKIQKLQQLRGRDDLLLAIPVEAKEAFASIAQDFPLVFYQDQLSATDVLQVLRSRYDDFAERLARLDVSTVREQVRREGLLSEKACCQALCCYRRSELQRAAELIVDEEIAFLPGIGLYYLNWIEQLKQAFLVWMHEQQSASLSQVLYELKSRNQALQVREDTTIEALLNLWPEVQIRRDSIFDVQVELVENVDAGDEIAQDAQPVAISGPPGAAESGGKRTGERRAVKKRVIKERSAFQEDLWG
jgi:predicted nuclease of restriction endonuclease-like RecB superfamily